MAQHIEQSDLVGTTVARRSTEAHESFFSQPPTSAANDNVREGSPTIGQCISGGLGWREVECNRCKTRASLPLDAIRRPRDTKLGASLKWRSCRKGRYAPPVRMIKLTE